MYITIDDIKKHLNIEECYKEDDKYLAQLYEVALNAVAYHSDIQPDMLVEGGELLPTARHAVLLLIGHLYNNRESTTSLNIKELPIGYDYLIGLFKFYGSRKIEM